MPRNAIKITGLKQLRRNLNDVKVKVADEANRVMKTEEAPEVLRRAKQLVPVKSGRLRDSGKLVLAVRERKDFQVVVIEALTKHLAKKGGKR